MLNRRSLLQATVALAVVGATRPVEAYETCNEFGQCNVGIDLERLNHVYATQKMDLWCWAASISMIFAYYGYDVPQEQIVTEAYGGIINERGRSMTHMAQLMHRDWRDQQGRWFRSRVVAAYDAQVGHVSLDNRYIVNELREGRPLLFGNMSHAMVLTAVTQWTSPATGEVILQNMGFMDPWPGKGLRGIESYNEGVARHLGGEMTFLASPRVEAILW
jgi:hypothetical protein